MFSAHKFLIVPSLIRVTFKVLLRFQNDFRGAASERLIRVRRMNNGTERTQKKKKLYLLKSTAL